ncbi:CHAD domain-containing protein [Methylobacter sp. S3L5C]|uniref:CHAD domain-containing protein n=1 Tax=Methylobacter sp. S3L5C TaxID=2839024 RepID=UPI001FAB397F|nr:CHAD domain-containing protein [Methylobacter sp. S3L5C]UOA07032.1 CHAD domain-containing protein [Methylobacter sp. S3L5C]
MSLQFDFPASLSAEKFIAKLSNKINMELVCRQYSLKTYYDSFDWRLYKNGITCEFNRSKSTSTLVLKNFENNLVIASTEIKEVPAFCEQFLSEEITGTLAPLLEMRALLPVCNLDYETYHLNIINNDQKTILRLVIEEHDLFKNRVTVLPIKGYDKAADSIIETLTEKLGLTTTNKPLLVVALSLQGRKPNDYSSKMNINLDPDMRADIAGKYIFSHLLNAIKDNEHGTIADTDSEFLHDFRVAVRRTRAGLSQLKGVLPDEITAYYAEFFSWLGQITSPTRDLDVYLLNFAHFKDSLPISIRENINPLQEFILAKQQKAQKELAKKLRSAKYLSTMYEWEQYLKEQAPLEPVEPNAKLTIKQLANQRISKSYKRILAEGDAIDNNSPSEALHDLRKSCKKLRYLMEFFQSLYHENQIKQFIKNLKGLQEVLGDFQDYAVQENTLKLFSEEMLSNNIHANTLLAMGVLIQNLDTLRCNARKDFSSKFLTFRHEENHSAFKSLINK